MPRRSLEEVFMGFSCFDLERFRALTNAFEFTAASWTSDKRNNPDECQRGGGDLSTRPIYWYIFIIASNA
jgi:hypothetical protein